MRKIITILPFLIFSLAFCACSSNKTTSSDVSSMNSTVSSSAETSISNTTASLSAQVNGVEDEEEAIPVEEDNKLNEAFLPDYDNLQGVYETQSGKVASANIVSYGCEVTVFINMEKDAGSHYEWELTATLDGSNLSYTGACCMIVTNNIDDPDYEVIYLDGEGYFEVVEGKLHWCGASEAENKDLVFVKISE